MTRATDIDFAFSKRRMAVEQEFITRFFEHMKVTYWLDGGWGVDVLTGKQQRRESQK